MDNYNTTLDFNTNLLKDPSAKLTRHYTKNIPDASLYKISMALE